MTAIAAPSASGAVGVRDQLPEASAVAVPMEVPPMLTVMVAPGSEVPEMVGVLSLQSGT